MEVRAIIDVGHQAKIDLYGIETTYQKNIDMIMKMLAIDEQELVRGFLRRMELLGMSRVQMLKDLQALRYFKSFTRPVKLLDVTSQDLENFLISMKELKPGTRQIRWYSLKKFYGFAESGHLFSKIKVRFNIGRRAHALPEEILMEEDIDRMVEYCDNERNRSLAALLYESGCRIGEFLNLKVSNVMFDKNGAIIIVDGKTGQRRIRIVKYAKLLARMTMFRERDERVFNLNYANAKKILKGMARKAGVKKRVNPHMFRHARATHLAKHLTEAQMKEFFGWYQGSEMAGVYVHLSGRDIDDVILKVYEKGFTLPKQVY